MTNPLITCGLRLKDFGEGTPFTGGQQKSPNPLFPRGKYRGWPSRSPVLISSGSGNSWVSLMLGL